MVAPLKRYSFNFGMDSKYSLTSSVVEFTPRIGVSMRLGDRETIGLSYSHPMPANVSAPPSNSVIVWTNFRVMSWGKIPKSH